MEQVVNKTFKPLFTENSRYFILLGGRGAGRSTVASQFALAKLVAPEYFRCSIMRFILGDIRDSIYREIIDRAEESGVKDALTVTDNTMSLSYGTNSINAKGFRKSQGDQRAKLKSLANYNCVIIEEADEVPEEDFMQLDDSLRTVKSDIKVILLLNPPPRNHWIIKRWFNLKASEAPGFYIPELKPEHTDTTFIYTNYKDNIQNITPQSVKNYERYRETKPDHYWNMVRGYVPEIVQGRIYTGWKEVDEVPHEAQLLCYGLDFGFDPDPAALVAIYRHNGGFILDEIAYQTHLKNAQLGNIIRAQPEKALVVADSAEPKSIAELKDMGIDIVGVEKGRDSVRFGIKKVQGMRISYTKGSKNIKAEVENYRNKVDKNGDEVALEDPACANHAMSATRYGFMWEFPEDPEKEFERKLEIAQQQHERVRSAQQDAGL